MHGARHVPKLDICGASVALGFVKQFVLQDLLRHSHLRADGFGKACEFADWLIGYALAPCILSSRDGKLLVLKVNIIPL